MRALAGLETSPQELLTRLNSLAVDLDAQLVGGRVEDELAREGLLSLGA